MKDCTAHTFSRAYKLPTNKAGFLTQVLYIVQTARIIEARGLTRRALTGSEAVGRYSSVQ